MGNAEIIYYEIEKFGMIGRGEKFSICNIEIYDADKGWVRDDWSIISDYLMGYDPSEPPGSPYGIGSLSIMDEIEVIPEKEAQNKIKEGYNFRLGDNPRKWGP